MTRVDLDKLLMSYPDSEVQRRIFLEIFFAMARIRGDEASFQRLLEATIRAAKAGGDRWWLPRAPAEVLEGIIRGAAGTALIELLRDYVLPSKAAETTAGPGTSPGAGSAGVPGAGPRTGSAGVSERDRPMILMTDVRTGVAPGRQSDDLGHDDLAELRQSCLRRIGQVLGIGEDEVLLKVRFGEFKILDEMLELVRMVHLLRTPFDAFVGQRDGKPVAAAVIVTSEGDRQVVPENRFAAANHWELELREKGVDARAFEIDTSDLVPMRWAEFWELKRLRTR